MDLLIRWFLGLLICLSNFLSVDLYFDPSISWSHIWSSFWSDLSKFLSLFICLSYLGLLICWSVHILISGYSFWSIDVRRRRGHSLTTCNTAQANSEHSFYEKSRRWRRNRRKKHKYVHISCEGAHTVYFLCEYCVRLWFYIIKIKEPLRGCLLNDQSWSFAQSPVDQRILLTRVFLTRVQWPEVFWPEDFWPEGSFDQRVYLTRGSIDQRIFWPELLFSRGTQCIIFDQRIKKCISIGPCTVSHNFQFPPILCLYCRLG